MSLEGPEQWSDRVEAVLYLSHSNFQVEGENLNNTRVNVGRFAQMGFDEGTQHLLLQGKGL